MALAWLPPPPSPPPRRLALLCSCNPISPPQPHPITLQSPFPFPHSPYPITTHHVYPQEKARGRGGGRAPSTSIRRGRERRGVSSTRPPLTSCLHTHFPPNVANTQKHLNCGRFPSLYRTEASMSRVRASLWLRELLQ
ncbi:hypothetical protein BU24DRAFT_123369 [Aaosphaeria arxii CBS 175.79]|uniref:Uncharacterized protein n=1 Tax=Aaosphaeria arxii CBS 175.79 TaxID=1450172 RepID=A0A6A5Y257_9PLEO|nr:uncharacterized protein BU24DRAFT_123369 [Aaosphaeria arxii CBS 175.79]KAF2019602.1 hypothetical protein BU24DRAFT_123369 [Aaosphaeria arxii CBS 175.79]